MAVVPQIYEKIETERRSEAQQAFQKKLNLRNYSSGNSLRHTILGYVVDERYEMARRELVAYVESKVDYPAFASRTDRLVAHAVDLITAISAKREFHEMGILSFAKQQELFDKVLGHFDELAGILNRMEHIERDLRIVDLRSTVWVLSTFVVCVAAVYAVAFYNQVNRRTLEDIVFVSDWALTNLYRFIFSLF